MLSMVSRKEEVHMKYVLNIPMAMAMTLSIAWCVGLIFQLLTGGDMSLLGFSRPIIELPIFLCAAVLCYVGLVRNGGIR